MIPVNFEILSRAMLFYQKKGYKYIDVPWAVSKPIADLTRPPGALEFPYRNDMLVASGEQSFLQLIVDGKLPKGKYICVTPCFRDETDITEGSRWFFMKAELINTSDTSIKALIEMFECAQEFFNHYLPTNLLTTGHSSYDIMSGEAIELGSYGIRNEPATGPWIYGTGCAEPRLSYAIDFHKQRIKQVLGTSKLTDPESW